MSDSFFVPVPRRWWDVPHAERRAASRLAASPAVSTEGAGTSPVPTPEVAQPHKESPMKPSMHPFMIQARALAAEKKITLTKAMSMLVSEQPALHADFLEVSRQAPKRAS